MQNNFSKLILNHLCEGKDSILFVDDTNRGNKISYTQFHEQLVSLSNMYAQFRNKVVLCKLSHNANSLATIISLACAGCHVLPVDCEISAQELILIAEMVNTKIVFIDIDLSEKYLNILKDENLFVINVESSQLLRNDFELSKNYSEFTEPKLILATSGTTGEPKMMVIDWKTLFLSGIAYINHVGINLENRKYWNFLPLNYLGGIFNLFLIPLVSHSTIYMNGQFSGNTFLSFQKVINKESINTLWVVPSILKGLQTIFFDRGNARENVNLEAVDYFFIGTAPVDQNLVTQFESEFKVTFIENYGLSETTFISSDIIRNGRVLKKAILPWVDVKIHNKELMVRSPFMMNGYLNELKSKNNHEEFFQTGDLVSITKNSLSIIGRQKQIIKKGGVLINLSQIESLCVSANIPNFVCSAVPIKSDFYGEDYVLFIEDEFSEEITRIILETLPRLKAPQSIKFIEKIPRTKSGKIKKILAEYEKENV